MTSIYPSSTTSSNSSTSSKNLMRISGMASGIDTDAVVKSMVSNYQTKIDKANQAKQMLQWKQESYKTIIKEVKGLQEYFDVSSSKYILSSNALNSNTTVSDEPSILSANAGADTKAGTYKVSVSQLAEQAKVEGSYKNSLIELDTSNIKTNWEGKILKFSAGSINIGSIEDLDGKSGITADELVAEVNKQIANSNDIKDKIFASYVNDGNASYIKFTKLSSDDITLKESDNTSIPDITSALGAGKTMTMNSGISSSSKLTDLGFQVGTDISFALNSDTPNITLSVTSDTTLKSLIDKVNSATSGAVTLNVDSTTGKISFQSSKYGSISSVNIKDTSGTNNVISTLGISTDAAVTSVTKAGKDAIVAITAPNQTSKITTTQTSNKFTMDGISYNLVDKGDANVTVTSDSDKVVTNMKNFIKDYNTVITDINTKLTEKKNTDYPPLTDSQKESMSEDQINAWESKAKVGILRNDDFLSKLATELRGVFSSPVYSNYEKSNTNTGIISLSFGQYGSNAVGLDTSSKIADSGKLVLQNETKFKDAIQNNFEDFKKLFIGTSSSSLVKDAAGNEEAYIGSKKYKEDGIFKRMDLILRDYVAAPGIGEDGNYTLSGSMNIFVNKQYDYGVSGGSSKNTLPDQVYNKSVIITNLNKQMSAAETRYYNKFTALETAMNKLNSQQSSLSSMLGTS